MRGFENLHKNDHLKFSEISIILRHFIAKTFLMKVKKGSFLSFAIF